MKKYIKIIYIALVLPHFVASSPAICQTTKFSTEEHFHDLFITAGYSTAFGAALGAACIGLSEYPSENLKYIAMGASFGFITGSFLGTYIIFSPMVSFGKHHNLSNANMAIDTSQTRLRLHPILNLRKQSFTGINAQWTLASF